MLTCVSVFAAASKHGVTSRIPGRGSGLLKVSSTSSRRSHFADRRQSRCVRRPSIEANWSVGCARRDRDHAHESGTNQGQNNATSQSNQPNDRDAKDGELPFVAQRSGQWH